MIKSLIVAISENGVIGNDNQLIWHLPKDLKYFKSVTNGHPIIMGRKTFDSIGKPLPGRLNIVVSRKAKLEIEGCLVVNSIDEAFKYANDSKAKECFVIGGAEIYHQSLSKIDKIYLTRVHSVFEGNTQFQINLREWKETSNTKHLKDEANIYDFSFMVLERV